MGSSACVGMGRGRERGREKTSEDLNAIPLDCSHMFAYSPHIHLILVTPWSEAVLEVLHRTEVRTALCVDTVSANTPSPFPMLILTVT